MKLALTLGEKQYTVSWDKDLSDFPHVVKYDSRYWEWMCWDKDPNGLVDQVLMFGETKESALAVDMYGNMFPVPDLVLMFDLNGDQEPCSCGAKFTSFPSHHMIKCSKWSRI